MTAHSESLRRQQVKAVLVERARALARPALDIGVVPTVETVHFTVGNERYAIEAAFVHRLERLGGVTPLPGAARHFTGVTNLHGQLVPVVDLRVLLGATPCTNARFAVVLGEQRAEIGIVAETLVDMRALPCDLLGSPAKAPRPLVRRILPDGTAVIDGAAVLADPRLIVGEIPTDTPYEEKTR
ncbi:MAG TPA: chemotaxis protein CheW [Candidatus Lustribacter sp.]